MPTTQETLDKFTAAMEKNTRVLIAVHKQLDVLNQILLQVKKSEGNAAMIGKLFSGLGRAAIAAAVRGA